MNGISLKETTPDFRDGFNFAVKAIHDVFKGNDEYTIEKLDDLLTSIVMLIDKGAWWPEIKKVIINEKIRD